MRLISRVVSERFRLRPCVETASEAFAGIREHAVQSLKSSECSFWRIGIVQSLDQVSVARSLSFASKSQAKCEEGTGKVMEGIKSAAITLSLMKHWPVCVSPRTLVLSRDIRDAREEPLCRLSLPLIPSTSFRLWSLYSLLCPRHQSKRAKEEDIRAWTTLTPSAAASLCTHTRVSLCERA